MKIYVKTRLKCLKSKVESFGGNRYFVYLISEKHAEGKEELLALLSRHLGVPIPRIEILTGEESDDKTFELR